jgi:iron complex outermembrane receptor protein
MKNRKFRRRPVAAAISVAFATGIATTLGAGPAFGQQTPERVERVEITGSSIKRIEAEGALPVQIITREEIEATSSPNVETYLNHLGVAMQGNSNSQTATASGATSGGVSSVSLRGLGSQRTLVLIDGRRVSAGGTLTDSTTVDVNHIPITAIERIEVLKDGASAVYGSDAIAGVINFILRKDYKGGEVGAHISVPQESGGKGWGANALIGWGDMATQRFNATLLFDFRKEEALFGRDRDFAASGINVERLNDTSSGNTFPANFAAADGSFGTRNLFFPSCPGPYSHFSPLFSPPSVGCRFDPAGLVTLIPETEHASIFGSGRFAISSSLEAYGQLSYSLKEQRTVIQPTPISDQFALPPNHPLFNVAPFNGFSTFLLRPTSPHYPTAFVQAETGGATPDLLVRWRASALGDRDQTHESEQKRAVIGLKGDVAKWEWDAAYLHIDTKLTEKTNNGFAYQTKILPLIDSGVVNPFGDQTPAVQAQIDATQFKGEAWTTKSSIDSLSAKLSRDLMKMPGGPLAFAFGLEGRKEGFKLDADPAIQTGDITGYGGNFLPVDEDRNVFATFAEVSVPIVRNVELMAAARYDDYEGVGSKTSPKFGARWQVAREALLRGSVGKGFRAPSLTELHQPQTTGVTAPGLNDPLRCGQPDGLGGVNNSVRDCVTQFPITLGGNPQLKPETSTNKSVGVVLEPIQNFSLALDWFSVELQNTIIFGVTPAAILADLNRFGSLVTRTAGPSDPACAGCPPPITDIQQTNINFGETHVEGFDVDFRYRLPAATAGVFTFGLNGTYISKYDAQNLDESFFSINDKVSPIVNGAGGVIPRWRHYAFVNWRKGEWDFTFAQNYQQGYQDIPGTFEDPTDPAFKPHKVGDYMVFHLSGSYQGLLDKNLRVTLGIRNLFDEDPPYTNAGGQNWFQSGYDPGYADPRGRTFYANLTYKFR